MTTLDQLEALADAATPGPWRYTANGVIGSDAMPDNKFIILWDDDGRNRFNDYPFIAAANPKTIKQLIALCRMQHDALVKYQTRGSMDDLESAGYAGDDALAAFEQFGKEEK
jgi:hypothetical protein